MSEENKLTHKRRVGRPDKWSNPEQLEEQVNEYLDITPVEDLTLTGLLIHINSNKQTLSDYEKKPEFRDIIKFAKLCIEHSYEIDLKKHGRAGSIFALKNFDWTDRREVGLEHTTLDDAGEKTGIKFE